jgi:hypothetical protein
MDWIDLLKTLGVSLTTVGGGIVWVWGKVEKRIAALEAEVTSCHADRTALLAAAELLFVALKQASPRSLALARARRLLDEVHELKGLD